MMCDDTVYTDTSTADGTCQDASTPVSDSDDNGNFTYCPNDPVNYTDDPDYPDTVFCSDATDYVDELDNDNNLTYDQTKKIHMRKLRIRVRKQNPAFWRHIRKLYHHGAAAEATQELLYWEQQHPIKSAGGS